MQWKTGQPFDTNDALTVRAETIVRGQLFSFSVVQCALYHWQVFTSNEMLNFVFRFSFNHNFAHCRSLCRSFASVRISVDAFGAQFTISTSAKLSMRKYKFWLKSVPNAYVRSFDKYIFRAL